MGDYKTVINENMSTLIDMATLSTVSWMTLDYMVRKVIHTLRLYCSFSAEKTDDVNMYKTLTMSKLNDLIIVRNYRLGSLQLSNETTRSIEKSVKHGPLGILLHIAPIQVIHAPPQVVTFCMYCKRVAKKTELVISDENDVFAPWKCPKCSSHYMVILDICCSPPVR